MIRKTAIILSLSMVLCSCGGNAENTSSMEQVGTNLAKAEELIEEVAPPIEEAQEVKEIEVITAVEEQTESKMNTPAPVTENHNPDIITSDAVVSKSETTPAVDEKKESALPEPMLVKTNHDDWNELTQKYVSSTGTVNYKGMKADLGKIANYLKHLETTVVDQQWSKNEKLAYWINLYNAATVYLIATNYPVKSINNISGGKPWDKRFIKANGKTYTLNEIENKIIRPRFKEPRIHAALNCAAKSCPRLLNEAYLPEKLEAQLTKQTRAWINDGGKNQLSPSKLKVSKIFEWYEADFKSSGGVIKFINKYSIKKFVIDPKAKVSYLEYDWSLNE